MADNEKEDNVSKVFTPFGVMVGDAGAMKSFDDASFYEEVLKPSEKATYEKYKKDFLKNPKGKVKKVSAGFIPWGTLVVQSKARNILMLNKIMSNTWALNKEAIPGFIDLIEKLRGKYSTVIGDDKLLEYLEAAQHRARELEASGEVSGSSSKPETNSSRNALRSALNISIFSGSMPVSQTVRYTANGIPVQTDRFGSEPCCFVGSTPVWIEEGTYSDRYGRHDGYIVSYESPVGDLCNKLAFPMDSSLEDIEEEVMAAVERDMDLHSLNSSRRLASSVEGSNFLFKLLRKNFNELFPEFPRNADMVTYLDNVKRNPDRLVGDVTKYGGDLGLLNSLMEEYTRTFSSRRIKSNAEGIDQQAYNNYVQQLVAMGIPEDQARQQADQLVAQLKQNTAQFAQNMQQPDQQGSMGLAASFRRYIKSGYVDPQIAGVNSVLPAFRQEFMDILDLWLAGELTDDEAVNSLVAGGLMSQDQADETVYEWQSKYEDDVEDSSGSDLTDADDVYGYQMDGIALPPKVAYSHRSVKSGYVDLDCDSPEDVCELCGKPLVFCTCDEDDEEDIYSSTIKSGFDNYEPMPKGWDDEKYISKYGKTWRELQDDPSTDIGFKRARRKAQDNAMADWTYEREHPKPRQTQEEYEADLIRRGLDPD